MSATSNFNVDGILALLRSRGMRITQSRRGIIQALFAAERPMSLAEIQKLAQISGGVLPDYATVFRMMTVLEALGVVHKVNLKRSCSYFELSHPDRHHDHLVCSECGKVTLLDIPCPVTSTEQWLEREYGYRGLSHSLEFFGVCPACLEKRGGVTIPFVSATPSDASSARPALA